MSRGRLHYHDGIKQGRITPLLAVAALVSVSVRRIPSLTHLPAENSICASSTASSPFPTIVRRGSIYSDIVVLSAERG